ncbi:hypothetical protein FRC08_016179 [Ceratobasidium sp. 394]|nr:hypothetical protein FRC08_016179 [Ceratobasidium sp. 394]
MGSSSAEWQKSTIGPDSASRVLLLCLNAPIGRVRFGCLLRRWYGMDSVLEGAHLSISPHLSGLPAFALLKFLDAQYSTSADEQASLGLLAELVADHRYSSSDLSKLACTYSGQGGRKRRKR